MPRTPPRLLAISDLAALEETPWTTWCATLAASGVDGLQVREKGLSDRARYLLARGARSHFPRPGRLLVSSRPDIARLTRADGVHLPVDGLPVAVTREILGPSGLVGRSTHSLDEVRAARDEGADYVLFGPVFETPSKAGILEPRGLDLLAAAVAIGPPVLALGGIGGSHAPALAGTGAWGIAGIRLFLPRHLSTTTGADLLAAWAA